MIGSLSNKLSEGKHTHPGASYVAILRGFQQLYGAWGAAALAAGRFSLLK